MMIGAPCQDMTVDGWREEDGLIQHKLGDGLIIY